MTTTELSVPSITDTKTAYRDADMWEPVPTVTLDPRETLDAVLDAWSEAAEADWDGEGAQAVSERTRDRACQFMVALLEGLPHPEVEASPHGTLLFQWYAAPRRRLTVSIGPSADLAFAALTGRTRQHGSAPLDGDGEVPDVVVDLIEQVAGWA